MARYLYVKGGVVVNVVEHQDTPPYNDNGTEIVPDLTGTLGVGDAFDMTDIRNDRRFDRVDFVIFRELFRLTNESRAQSSPPQGPLTAAQYRAFVKGLF